MDSSKKNVSVVMATAWTWIVVVFVVMTSRCTFSRAMEQGVVVAQDEASHDSTYTENSLDLSNFVRILESPESISQSKRVIVEYYCEEDSVVVLDLTVMLLDSDGYFTVFTKAWKCQGQGLEGQPKTKSVRLRLPDSLAYRPDYFNKANLVWFVSGAKLRAWLVDRIAWSRHTDGDVLASAKSRDFHKVTVPPPYTRLFKTPACAVWIWPYLQRIHWLSDSDACGKENEYAILLNYPAVFNGYAYSIIRDFFPFKHPVLERDRLHQRFFPQLTIEMWVYILDYCPMHHLSPADCCGLFMHMDRQGNFLTPSILITKDGNIQIDVKGASGFVAMKSMDVIPKHTWTRILFTLYYRTWVLHVNYGPDLTDGFWTSHTNHEDLFVDDTEGMMSLGGVDWTMGSFVGYMGRVVYHRMKVLRPDQLYKPDPYHPMFELHLTRRQEKCEHFLEWMDSAVNVFQRYRKYLLTQSKDICPYDAYLLFAKYLHNPPDGLTMCPPKLPFNLNHHRHVSRLLQTVVGTHSLSKNFLDGDLEAYSRNYDTDRQAALHDISFGLIDNATDLVAEKGLKKSSRVVHLLKQAACLGNDDAMFSLAVLLNNGVGGALDELQSLAFFMLGSLNRHIFSTMALGHRHTMGIDGAPVDRDVAYMYYKQVADQTRTDKELHEEGGIATESIRLIDEARIQAQTSEVGDLFLWLKHQAEKGVESAQSELGALLYHGSQGVKRNLQNAINVFKDGAELGNADSMYSYGIMQYRGLGAEANKTEGRRMLKKAAELKNPNAVSALGWLALEEQNMTQAFEMFTLAKKMGHIDAGYYLGYMHHFGLVPNHTIDLDKALEEYVWSAKKEQIDAGNVYAFLISRGTPKYPRHIYQAVEWARYIAEKNGKLAKPLRNALNAFRDGNNELALYYYLLLADTGLEVASFNLAYLCEMNEDGIISFMSKECQWRHYNLTTKREFQFVDAYSFIKMGDYHWYGCLGHRNIDEAARFYILAAEKGNPHALFNLAYMVEDGAKIHWRTWVKLGIHKSAILVNKDLLLLELYGRCRDSKQSEAFLPCCLAWFRVWFISTWEQYHLHMKITSLVGVLIVLATSSFIIYNYYLQRKLDQEEEADRQAAAEEEEEEDRRMREEIQEI